MMPSKSLFLLLLSWATITVLIHGIVPPKTPVLSGFEPAAIGTNRELVCDAYQPDAGTITYKWYKYSIDKGVEDWESKGPLIGKDQPSQRYIFNPVAEKQVFHGGTELIANFVSGRYKCRANNSAGTVDSEWEDLYVYTPCSLYTVSVSQAKPAVGSTFTLNCYIPNPSGISVQWTKKTDIFADVWDAALANSKGCHAPTSTRYTWSSCSPPSLSSKTNTFNLQVANAQTADSAYWICKDIGLSCYSDPVKIVIQAEKPGTPHITGFPAGPVSTGRKVYLKCVASPLGDTYDWYKDNKKSTVSLTYDFEVKKESAGVYKCVAKNTVGSASSPDVTLIVYSKADSVVVSSGKTSCHAGETDKFTCTATGGYPTPTLKIYIKRSGGTPVEVTQGQDRVMTKEDNQAEYYCEAKVAGYPAFDMTSTRKSYKVTFPNTQISFINNPKGAVQVGQVKTFKCETDESNPVTSIKWYQSVGGSFKDVTTGITTSERNGAYRGKIGISEFSVEATKPMNGGTVRCGSTYSLTGHGFAAKADIVMSVKFNPSKLTIQKPTAIIEGQPIKVTCETDSANPAAEIKFCRKRTGETTWVEQTSGITSKVSNAQQYNGKIRKSTLTVTANRLDNQAVFECKVQDGTFQVDQTTTVTVYYPPTVKISSNPTPVNEGEKLTLTCTASGGNPASYTYRWYYNNLTQSETSNEYNIAGIKYTQSGTYKCRAVNYSPGGKAENITEIDVQYKAKWNPALPELFTVASKTNEPVKFVLHVIANPSPTGVTWLFQNDSIIGESFTATNVNDTTYTLNKKSVTIKDYGNYTVDVTNAVGVSTFVFELQRAGPPYPPCCLKMINKTAVSVYLTFKSNFSGGSDQTFTIEQSPEGSRRKRSEWVKAAENIPDPGFEKDVFYKVKGLTKKTTYQFRVKAVNTNGSSGYNDPGNGNFLKVTTKAAPVADLVVGRKDDTVTISWGLERKYTKIQIEYCPVKGGGCLYHDVESPAKQGSTKFDVNKEQTYKYSLVVFDGDDKVFASPQEQPPPPTTNPAVIGGGAGAGILLFLIIIAVVVAVVFIKKRRAEKGNGRLVTSSNTEEGTVNAGFNNDADGGMNPYADSGMNPYTDSGMNPYADSFEMAASPGSTIQVEGAPGATYAVVNKGNKKPLLGGKGKKKDATPSGSQAYAEVDFSKKKKGKGKKKPETGEAGAAYAEVDFSKKKKGAAPSTPNGPDGAVYAQVNKKPPVGDEYAQVDFTKKASNKDAAPDTPGDVYAVVNKPTKPDKLPKPGTSDDQAVYANVNGMAEGNVDGMADDDVYEDVRDDALIKDGYKQPKTAYQVGVDGTIYSEVRIKPPKNPDVIIGKETIEDPYGSVDFTKEAPSLPEPEDPDDPNDPGFMILL